MTWEDFKISYRDEYIQSSGEIPFIYTKEDQLRDLREAREDYRRTWGGLDSLLAKMQADFEILRSDNIHSGSFDLAKNTKIIESLIKIMELRIKALKEVLDAEIPGTLENDIKSVAF